MEKKLDVKMVMRVFEKIRTHGQKTAEGYKLSGVEAISDFDGYTIFLKNREVTLTLFFHHRYDVQFTKIKAFDDFIKQLKKLDHF